MPIPFAFWMLSLPDFTSSGLGDSMPDIASLDVDVSGLTGDTGSLRNVLCGQWRRLPDALAIKRAMLIING